MRWAGSNPGRWPEARAAPTICVDPGHPSEINDGMTPVGGTTETHCNWAIALRLRDELESSGYRVVMTKSSEGELVTNTRRAVEANEALAALMVRLHCDTGGGSGFRVLYPDAAGRHMSAVGPGPLVRRQSRSAAVAMDKGLEHTLKERLRSNGVAGESGTPIGRRYGALIASVHCRVPVVTVEMGYLDNHKDAALLRSADGQAELARGLAAGVRQYVPPGVATRGDLAPRE